MDLALRIAYNGAPFAGFARQPEQKTVQGQIEHALHVLLKRDVETVGAGRTDSGVHALGQVMSVALLDTPAEQNLDLFAMRRSLEVLAGEGIAVRNIAFVPDGFSARFDALERTYRYRLSLSPERPLFSAPYVWHLARELDVASMRKAARLLKGEHDFESFCVTSTAQDLKAQGLSLSREITHIDLFEEEFFGEQCLTIEVRGNAFLHSMVRTLVGTLVEVGLGHNEPAWVQDVLAARSRSAAGQTAPAAGLTFYHVAYESALWE